ncbi:glycosyltransferase [Candidatus Gottesmanbacteria bacterium]|nr:glycosyltransferase [Candidatus Gottesmanbacteria bacterium]
MKNIFLSVVIPCYNEERNIRLGALEKVEHFMNKKNYSWEVVIVDDGSTDESKNLVKDFIKDNKNFHLIEGEHHGKAITVIIGMLHAKGKYKLFTDLDQATPISELEKLLDFASRGYDVVIGSRNSQRPGAPIFRLLMARGFMSLRNIILNLGISDTQCGFKLFTREASEAIFKRVMVYKDNRKIEGSTVTAGFDVEVLFIAKKLGHKIKEVPVEWHYQETRRVNPLNDSIKGLIDLLKIRLNSLKGLYA